MCEAISTATAIAIAGVAVSAASAGAGLYMQSEDAANKAEYQKKLGEARNAEIAENYSLAIQGAHQSYAALNERTRQEQEATSQQQEENVRAAAGARATARTAAGEAGVSGLSLDSLMADFTAQEARFRDALNTNLGYTTSQLEYEAKGVQSQGQGRVNAIRPYLGAPITKPNYLGAALSVGGDAVSAYNRYKAPTFKTGPYAHGADGSAF